MEAKFKIGDRVLVTLPETITNTGMKRLNGRVFPISDVYDLKGSFMYIIEGCTLIEGYLEKVEGVVNKQASEISKKQLLADEVAKAIDWEKRRWDLISSLVLKGKHIEIAIGIADEAILRHIEMI